MYGLCTILNVFVFCLCFLSNILAISLFKEFRDTKGKLNIAMQSTFAQFIMDIVFSFTNVLLRAEIVTVVSSTSNYLTFYFVYTNNFDLTFYQNCALVFVYCVIFFLNFLMTSITVFVRYCFVADIYQLKTKHLVGLIMIAILLLAILKGSFCFIGFDPTVDPYLIYHNDLMENYLDDFVNEKSRSVSLRLDWSFFIFVGPIFVFLTINFVAITVVLIKYKRYMATNGSKFSSQTRKLHQQFYFILCIQGIMPSFFQFFPLGLYQISCFFKVPVRSMGSWSVIIATVLPLLNSIVFLALISKSRTILKKRYGWLFKFLLTKENTGYFKNRYYISITQNIILCLLFFKNTFYM
uniref:G_PROTEIN_RECEP_F1_2 domain-containing protein n=1 Tax=Rhabditophanes sp. KR3021 TaxID=114890 RepID=A0AC35UE84_9BILA